MASIGFIGLGNMGGPMARNLVRAGHGVQGYDVNEEAMNFAGQAGVTLKEGVRDTVDGMDMVITMLPVGAHVRQVLIEEGGIEATAAGALMIDCSTIDVETSQAMHAAAAEAGIEMLDAPVSGGTAGADDGTLTFMCGGAQSTFDKVKPVLEVMGANVILCGGPGMGQVTKICNNMMCGAIYVATAEALVMGERLGVDRQILHDVISTASGSSRILTHSCPLPGPLPESPSSNGFKPGFMARLMLKDLRLAQAAAAMAGASTPVGAAAAAAFQMVVDAGHGDLDSSAIAKRFDSSV